MRAVADKHSIVFNPPGPDTVLFLPGLPGSSARSYDRSAYGNTATITGAVWKCLPGQLWYLDYDGNDDRLTIADAACLDIPGAFTILLWLRPDSTQSGTGAMVAAKCAATLRGWYIQASNADVVRFYVTSDDGGSAYAYRDGQTGIRDDLWHMVACVFKPGSRQDVYVDGVLDNGSLTGTVQAAANLTSNPVTFGDWADADIPFDGGIALPRLVNRALVALEVRNIYDREKGVFGVC